MRAEGSAALLPIIENYILPGTTIYSDQWKAYKNISRLDNNYTHDSVNHSRNFASPDTLAYTQNMDVR
jgi:hypothetical protein